MSETLSVGLFLLLFALFIGSQVQNFLLRHRQRAVDEFVSQVRTIMPPSPLPTFAPTAASSEWLNIIFLAAVLLLLLWVLSFLQ